MSGGINEATKLGTPPVHFGPMYFIEKYNCLHQHDQFKTYHKEDK